MTTVLIGQNDQFQGHEHKTIHVNKAMNGATTNYSNVYPASDNGDNTIRIVSDGTNGTPRVGDETRGKNLTVRYWKRIA